MAQLLDGNKIHDICSFGPLEVRFEITGIWAESRMTEYFEFLILDRIVGRFIEEDGFCFLASACFKPEVRKQEELKSFTCTHALLGFSNLWRSVGRENCVLCCLPHFLDHQESHCLTFLTSSKMGLQMFSGHSVGIASEE